GCSLSGGLLDILTANKITTELTISEAEWSESAIKALLPEMTPPTPLIIAKNKLANIPTHVVIYIFFKFKFITIFAFIYFIYCRRTYTCVTRVLIFNNYN